MIKSVALLGLVAFYLIGSISAAPEKAAHGHHGEGSLKHSHYNGTLHNQAYDFQAFLGTTDYNELADLPKDKRRTRLINLAKSHDTNKNGIIEKEELVEWIMHSFKMLERLETELLRKDDDVNRDGRVYFAEIVKRQYGYDDNETEAFEKTGNSGREGGDKESMDEMIKDEQVRFVVADVNHDGFLDSVEYVAYGMPYDHPHMHEVMVEKAFKELDKNKDNVINMKEFVESSDENYEYQRFEMSQFENFDKNKDGKLTKEEFRPWALHKDNESATEEADHLVNECDEDKDGHLSIDEIIKKEEDFIASQVTHYGKHLHYVKDEL